MKADPRLRQVVRDLWDDEATWVDVTFWMVMGALLSEGVHWMVRTL